MSTSSWCCAETASVDVAVFCLALMGTDYPSFLGEAARVLKPLGTIWIAEVCTCAIAAFSWIEPLRHRSNLEAIIEALLYPTAAETPVDLLPASHPCECCMSLSMPYALGFC